MTRIDRAATPSHKITIVGPVGAPKRVAKSNRGWVGAIGAERDHLILQRLPAVWQLAVRFRRTLPLLVDLEDLYQAGLLGLIHAAENFDATRNAKFSTHADHRCRGAMLDWLRELDPVPKERRRIYKRAEVVQRQLASKLGRKPNEAELREKMGLATKPKIDLHPPKTISLSASVRNVPDSRSLPDAGLEEQERTQAVTSALNALPTRTRAIVHRRYWRGETLKQIGNTFGLHESRVSQIITDAIDRLSKYFASRGITADVLLSK